MEIEPDANIINSQTVSEQFGLVMEWIKENIAKVNPAEIDAFGRAILAARGKTIWVTGAGASGLVAKMGAMRLAQQGFSARVLGEISAGPVREGDVLVVVSGSGGNFPDVIRETKYACGAKIILITHSRESPIGRFADLTVKIPSEDKETKLSFRESLDKKVPIFILNAAFEMSALMLFTTVLNVVAASLGLSDGDCQKLHARPIVPI